MKNRSVQDIFIALIDGLKGFPETIETVYPQTAVQLFIVHLLLNSLNYVGWKTLKGIADDLKQIDQAAMVAEAEQQRGKFVAQELSLPIYCPDMAG